MIELPSEIHDELTLALVKAQLPPGLAIAIRRKGPPPMCRLYVGACVRGEGAMGLWDPHKDTTEIVIPNPRHTCTQCGFSAGFHARPDYLEVREIDRTLRIKHNGETFIIRG